MPRYAYVNGRYVHHADAAVHIEDRGFQFADGVYEVIAIVDGRFIDRQGHMDRLERSMSALRIEAPTNRRIMEMIMATLVHKNGVRNGLVYLQVTRGVAPRDFRFPKGVKSTLVMTTRHVRSFATPQQLNDGVRVITIPDIRWQRRDIKTVGLLAQVLGKQQAAEAGAFEAWQIDPDGTVTEGCSSNAWIVTGDGVLITRPASHAILNGITRQTILRIAGELGVPFVERPFTLAEAGEAREAFISSASTFAMPVTRIDDRTIGGGKPGPLCRRLRDAYLDHAVASRPIARTGADRTAAGTVMA